MIRLELPESPAMRVALENVLEHAYAEQEYFKNEDENEEEGDNGDLAQAFQQIIDELRRALNYKQTEQKESSNG